MNTFLSVFAKLLLIPVLLLSHFGAAHAPAMIPQSAPTQALGGTFNPTGGGTYRLQSSIGLSDSTITLTSFKEPVSGIPYTMAYLNSTIEFATIEPQSTTKEFVSFSGITQNSDGSATLTGVVRGLGFSYPYTASSTLQEPHPAQAILILSNPPQLYNQYANINNAETITGNWDVPFPADSNSVVPRSYVDGAAFGGIGGASETATGTVQIASGLQVASSTKNGSIGRLVIPSSLSTSTWSASIPVGTVPAIGTIGGHIDPNFIALASTTVIGSTPALQIGKHEFVATSTTTFTIPNGVSLFHVRVVGCGGNGASSDGGGGGGGGYTEGNLSTTTTLALVIAPAGSWGTATTTIGGVFTATCGINGAAAGGSGQFGTGGTGGVGSGGAINMNGADGMNGVETSSGTVFAGNGGSSVLGGGGRAGNPTSANNGGNYGGGGGGVTTGGAGTGSPGAIIIDY